jgi:hypothetical protein
MYSASLHFSFDDFWVFTLAGNGRNGGDSSASFECDPLVKMIVLDHFHNGPREGLDPTMLRFGWDFLIEQPLNDLQKES